MTMAIRDGTKCPRATSRFARITHLTRGNWRLKMGLAQYAIVPVRDQWGVLHDGNVNGEYATKESAFESAIAAASLAIRMGHEVHVSVPGRNEGEAALTQRAR